MSEVEDVNTPAPRLCHIRKVSDYTGYGFNLHWDKVNLGQYVGKIEDGSPAQSAGLREGDRIIEVNGVNIGQETHQEVVERIREKEDETVFLVVDDEADAFFKEKNILIDGSLPCIVRLDTSDTSAERGHQTSNHPEPLHKARLCHLKIWPDFNGYGFNLHVNKETMMHYVGKVDKDSPAEKAGLMEHDILVTVNGKDVHSFSHADVVKTVKEDSSAVKMMVLDENAFEYFKTNNIDVNQSSHFIEEIFCPDANPNCQQASETEEIRTVCSLIDQIHPHQLRLCHIKSWDDGKGFGFNMQSEKNKPGQYIVKVDEGSPAMLAGMLEKDFLLEVNGESVEGLDHKQVVDKIKSDLTETKLLVVDPEAKSYFESQEIKMYGSLDCIKTITSPDSNPDGNLKASKYVNGSNNVDKENLDRNKEVKKELILDVKNIPSSALYSTQSSTGSPTSPITIGDVEFAATADEARRRMAKKKQANQQMSVKAKYEMFQKM